MFSLNGSAKIRTKIGKTKYSANFFICAQKPVHLIQISPVCQTAS